MGKEWEEWVVTEQGQVVSVYVLAADIVNHTRKDSLAIRKDAPDVDR